MSEPFVFEGELWFGEQEGGYDYPSWELNNGDLSEKVIEHFNAKSLWASGIKFAGMRSTSDIPMGRVRITIEQLEKYKP